MWFVNVSYAINNPASWLAIYILCHQMQKHNNKHLCDKHLRKNFADYKIHDVSVIVNEIGDET